MIFWLAVINLQLPIQGFFQQLCCNWFSQLHFHSVASLSLFSIDRLHPYRFILRWPTTLTIKPDSDSVTVKQHAKYPCPSSDRLLYTVTKVLGNGNISTSEQRQYKIISYLMLHGKAFENTISYNAAMSNVYSHWQITDIQTSLSHKTTKEN